MADLKLQRVRSSDVDVLRKEVAQRIETMLESGYPSGPSTIGLVAASMGIDTTLEALGIGIDYDQGED